MSTLTRTQLQTIVEQGHLAQHHSQEEYAYTLIQEFNALRSQFPARQPTKLLFSVDDSQTFSLRHAVAALDDLSLPKGSDLDLEFAKSGFPLPAARTVAQEQDGVTHRWRVTVFQPQHKLVDAGLSVEGRTVTFGPGFSDGEQPADALVGAGCPSPAAPGRA
jgi:hypothetical protein